MSVTVVVGGQYGSEGKGKVCAHLAVTGSADLMVRCGGPNSGHTVHTKAHRYQLRQVPAGFLNPETRLLLAPGALVDPAVFLREVHLCDLDPTRIGIDRNAGVIEPSDSDHERRESLQARLGSTGVGMGAAVSRRVVRSQSFRVAANVPELRPFITNVACELGAAVRSGRSIVVEGTQGFGLSLYHTEEWPFCTSRDTTAHSFLGEAGLGVRDFEVIMAIRTFPIRVGGNSGPLANEITWEDVRRRSRYPEPVNEYTTTTHRLRRVAEFHWDVVLRAVDANRPSQLALHGTDYLDFENRFANSFDQLTKSAKAFIETLADRTAVPVTLVGTGPRVDEIIDLRSSLADAKDSHSVSVANPLAPGREPYGLPHAPR